MVIGTITDEQKRIVNDIYVHMIIRQYKMEREKKQDIKPSIKFANKKSDSTEK